MIKIVGALLCVIGISLFSYGQVTSVEIKTQIDSLLEFGANTSNISINKRLNSLERAYELAKNNGDIDRQIKALGFLSKFSLSKLQNFDKAISYLAEIKELAKKNDNDPQLLIEYHNSLGSLYFLEGTNSQRAFKEFNIAFDLSEKHSIEASYSLLSNYALALIEEEEVDRALEQLRKALINYKRVDVNNSPVEFPIIANTNIGVCYIHKNNMDSAEYYLKVAKDLAYATKVESLKLNAAVYLGVYYQETQNDQKAIAMLEEAEGFISSVSGSYETKALLYEGKSLSYYELKDFSSAYLAKVSQEIYEDSLIIAGLNEQAFRYDYNVRIDSLQRAKELSEVRASLEQESLENKIYFYLLIILLILSVGGFAVYRLIKRNQVAKVKAKNERLEHLHKMQEAELSILKSEEKAISANIELSAKKNELQELKALLEKHVESSDDPQFSQLRAFLNRTRSSEKRGEQLRFLDELVSNSNNEFYDRLRKIHPDLKKGDRRLAFLIKLSLSTEELMLVFNISKASLYTKRYRLKGKLNLSDNEDLDNYLHTL